MGITSSEEYAPGSGRSFRHREPTPFDIHQRPRLVTSGGRYQVVKGHEAVSARQPARLFAVPHWLTLRILREAEAAGRTGFEHEGGPLLVHGTWFATYEWWTSQVTHEHGSIRHA